MHAPSTSVRVWDLPTRLFHWSIVALIGFSWWSAEVREMDWHRLSGITVLALVVFRLLWGFIGGSTARFTQFVRAPGRVMAYLRPGIGARRTAGHNPLGGYSVVLMLALLSIQVVTGVFAVDVDGIESGPLSFLVSFDQGRTASAVHHISFTALQIVAGIHILAVLFYLVVKKLNLIRPMVTGSDKALESREGALVPASPMRVVVAAAVAAAIAYAVWKGFWI